MRLVILSRSRVLHSTRRLAEEARLLGVEALVVNPLRCVLSAKRGDPSVFVNGKRLEGIDVVLPRIGTSITEYGLLVVRHFEAMGVPVVNESDAILNSRNKFRALQVCAGEGLDIPDSVLTRSLSDVPFGIRIIRSFPLVLKMLQGSQGIGVMVAHSRSSVESILSTMLSLEKEVILQQFIREAAGCDIRALVINGRAVAAMKRMARGGEFRANIHRGGKGMALRLPKRYEQVAVRAARAVGLDVAGVDILESDSGPKILEINSSPGFQELERATGENIAREMVRMAMKKARQGRRT
ncbi:MAG: RimK family alpha-L-glutamate ligase [Bdellovibrionales bacterium]|nr:RimK family alpha-L-glutamate ligase [Bdellovibrionales bacterium]